RGRGGREREGEDHAAHVHLSLPTPPLGVTASDDRIVAGLLLRPELGPDVRTDARPQGFIAGTRRRPHGVEPRLVPVEHRAHAVALLGAEVELAAEPGDVPPGAGGPPGPVVVVAQLAADEEADPAAGQEGGEEEQQRAPPRGHHHSDSPRAATSTTSGPGRSAAATIASTPPEAKAWSKVGAGVASGRADQSPTASRSVAAAAANPGHTQRASTSSGVSAARAARKRAANAASPDGPSAARRAAPSFGSGRLSNGIGSVIRSLRRTAPARA